MTEWWSMQTGIWIGSLGGAAAGVLGGGLGAMAGYCAPRGKCKGLVLGTQTALVAVGVVALIAGIVALATGQPRHVYYPLLLGGFTCSVVMGSLLPVVRMRYRQAEQRRLDAGILRDA
ncbi:MAG: hypothetical protein GIKADHBN_00570 [Phycisphaerales bacterium]|nr:hypothetical protein [Phycisphaerales bacterium]